MPSNRAFEIWWLIAIACLVGFVASGYGVDRITGHDFTDGILGPFGYTGVVLPSICVGILVWCRFAKDERKSKIVALSTLAFVLGYFAFFVWVIPRPNLAEPGRDFIWSPGGDHVRRMAIYCGPIALGGLATGADYHLRHYLNVACATELQATLDGSH